MSQKASVKALMALQTIVDLWLICHHPLNPDSPTQGLRAKHHQMEIVRKIFPNV